MNDFILGPADRNSGLWRRLASYLEARLEELRRQNDNSHLDERQTASLRGRIAQVNELLALAKPAPEVEP